MDLTSVLSIGLTIPALLTASASLLALVIAKENKVSDARQAWINELRDELSRFIALTRQNAQYWNVLESELAAMPDPSDRAKRKIELSKDHFPHAIATSTSVARVKLMLAAHETTKKSKVEVDALIKRLTEIQCAYESVGDTLKLTIDLHAQAGPVMQAEWRRVRIGEPIYRWVLRASAALGVALLLLIITAALQGRAEVVSHVSNIHDQPKIPPLSPRKAIKSGQGANRTVTKEEVATKTPSGSAGGA